MAPVQPTGAAPPSPPASLLEALNRHHVAYVLIGGVAARARGATLRTGDLDIRAQVRGVSGSSP